MDKQLYAVDPPNDPALTLKTLVELIDNPQASAKTRLNAVQTPKKQLISLKRLIEAQETPPEFRKDIIETLRPYRRR
jgi:hypothetical protein